MLHKIPKHRRLLKLAIAACLWHACLGSPSAAESAHCTVFDTQERHVHDMAGRTITLPHEVRRIATVGSVPVLNGYLMALGAGERIINGLPSRFTASGRWRLHHAVAPYLVDKPALQGQSTSDISIESIARLAPDVIITMNPLQVRVLEKAKTPVVYLEWADTADILANMRVLGCMTGLVPESETYLRYFEDTMGRVRQTLEGASGNARPKVLYFNPHSMNTPLQIANWWIAQAGGQSVTADVEHGGNVHYSHERVLLWNPDILIVNSPVQVEAVYQDERFSKINAVRNGRVYATPMGTHSWGQRTVEQPLTVLWAATIFHPEHFGHIDMNNEITNFYRRFFNYHLSDHEIQAMLDGRSE